MRASNEDPATVSEVCEPRGRLQLKELLNSQFWQHRFYGEESYDYQPTLFQPIGGIDKIVDGFTRKIGHLINYDAR